MWLKGRNISSVSPPATNVGLENPRTSTNPSTFLHLPVSVRPLSITVHHSQLGMFRHSSTFTPAAVPEPPENLKWRDKSAKGIFLSWEPPRYDGGAPIKGYVVDKCQRGTDKWEPCGEPIPELK